MCQIIPAIYGACKLVLGIAIELGYNCPIICNIGPLASAKNGKKESSGRVANAVGARADAGRALAVYTDRASQTAF